MFYKAKVLQYQKGGVMRKLIFITCLVMFLAACTSVSNVAPDNSATVKRPTLSQIHKKAKELVVVLKKKEQEGTLTDEEKDVVQKLKGFDEAKEAVELKKYVERPITSEEIFTIAWASEEGYTMEEIDKFLKLGLYVKNPYCEKEFKSYEVFQVLPSIVLTHGCEITSYSECSTSHGKIFMFPKLKDELYFDNKILTPSAKECPTIVGVYTYEANNGMKRTVPVLVFMSTMLDKEQLKLVETSREESQKIFE